jgi:Fe2+ or Zn2+ uptake regulation protein
MKETHKNTSKKVIEEKVQSILENTGLKHSYLRCDLLFLFVKESKPVSVPIILDHLLHKGKAINKTSVYREVEKLLSLGVIKEVILPGGNGLENCHKDRGIYGFIP